MAVKLATVVLQNLLSVRHGGHVDGDVRDGERTARMNEPEFLVGKSSSVHGLGNIDLAFNKLRTAPTATAASAIGRRA